MLGDEIGRDQGKVTSRRILPGDDYRFVKMEISFESQGTVYGAAMTNMGTYTVYERVPGQLYGEGQGIIQTMDGEGAIWKGHGVGHADASMNMAFAFSIAVQAGPGKLAKLNDCLIVGEQKVDAQGNATTVTYEWKA